MSAVTAVGDEVVYTFTITNTGTETVNDLQVNDSLDLEYGPSCPDGESIAAGATVTCEALYVVTQDDLNANTIENTATAHGTTGVAPDLVPVESLPATATVQVAKLTLTKTSDVAAVAAEGDVIPYTFTIENPGTADLTGVTVEDPNVTGLAGCPADLAAGATLTCTGTYTVTADDIARGFVKNSATAVGATADGVQAVSKKSTVMVPVTPAAIKVVKTADKGAVAVAGDVIEYTFTLTNTGEIDLVGIVVNDPIASATGCPTELAAGETASCTASYTVTADDIAAGGVENTVTVTANTSSGTPVTATDEVTVPVSALTITKTADTQTVPTGGKINYTYTVTNGGTATETNLNVTDEVTTGTQGNLSALACKIGTVQAPLPVTALAPGQTLECSASYNVTETTGTVVDVASVESDQTQPQQSNEVTVTVTATSPLTLTKKGYAANADGSLIHGDAGGNFCLYYTGSWPCQQDEPYTVTPTSPAAFSYEFTVTNNDPVQTMTDIKVIDQQLVYAPDTQIVPTTPGVPSLAPGALVPPVEAVCPKTELEHGESMTCTYLLPNSLEIWQSGAIANTAVAYGTLGGTTTSSKPASLRASNNEDSDMGWRANVDPYYKDVTPYKTALAETVHPDGTKTYSPVFDHVGQTVIFTFTLEDLAWSRSRFFIKDQFVAPSTGPLQSIACPQDAASAVQLTARTSAGANVMTCTATYLVTQDDLDRGYILNAVQTWVPFDNDSDFRPLHQTEAKITAEGSIKFDKEAIELAASKVGDKIHYNFTVTNDGPSKLTNIQVFDKQIAPASDSAMSDISCPKTELGEKTDIAAGESMVCTGVYTVTQDDLDDEDGFIDDEAWATGYAVGVGELESKHDKASVPVVQLQLVKDVSRSVVKDEAGDSLTYYFTVTNPSETTVNDLSIVDDGTLGTVFNGAGTLGPISCADTSLAPGASTLCQAAYTVDAADLEPAHTPAGVTNKARATGSVPNQVPAGGETPDPVNGWVAQEAPLTVVSNLDPAVFRAPKISLVKSADKPIVSEVGETVTYTFTVTNDGYLTVRNVSVEDLQDQFTGTGKLSPVKCKKLILTRGTSTECYATYEVTEADIAAGKPIVNVAVAHATAAARVFDPENPDAPTVSVPVDSNEDDAVVNMGALALTKQASPSVVAKAGEEVTYYFTVTNHSEVEVRGVSVTDVDDEFTGKGAKISDLSCPATVLAAGASMVCTAHYTAVQDDIDAGELIHNVAVAKSTTAMIPPKDDPTGDPVETPLVLETPEADADVDVVKLDLVKTASPKVVSTVGEQVTYSFVVTNISKRAVVHDLVVQETEFSGTGKLSKISCPTDTLQVAEQVTCTATYKVTQEDLDARQITNTAVAGGTTPSTTLTPDPEDPTAPPVPTDEPKPVVSPPDDEIVLVSKIDLVKSADPGVIGKAGETVNYRFTVTNTGAVTLTNVTVNETEFSGTGEMSPIVCPVTTLAVGESTVCTATYQVTQADMDSKKKQIDNTAVATGTDPEDKPVVSPPDDAVVHLILIDLVKQADRTVVHEVGEIVTYTFTVTNKSNIPVTGVSVQETAFSGTGTVSPITCPVTTLQPKESTDCTATYEVTAADIESGKEITNVAVATSTGALLPPPEDPTGDPVDTPVEGISPPDDEVIYLAKIDLVKSATPTLAKQAGQVVDYTFVVTNVGSITVTDVVVEETEFTGTGKMSKVSCPVTTLQVGESVTCTASYKVTQADIDAGEPIHNTAVAKGKDPAGNPVPSPPDDAVVNVERVPAITLLKSVTPGEVKQAGDKVTYTFHVTNTGNITLHEVRVDETQFSGTGKMSPVVCPETTLAPGQAMDCTAEYAFTQTDINVGKVTNTAVAQGMTPPKGDEPGEPVVSNPSTAEVIAPDPLVNTGSSAGMVWAGTLSGVGLIGAGVLLMLARRRRREHVDS